MQYVSVMQVITTEVCTLNRSDNCGPTGLRRKMAAIIIAANAVSVKIHTPDWTKVGLQTFDLFLDRSLGVLPHHIMINVNL